MSYYYFWNPKFYPTAYISPKSKRKKKRKLKIIVLKEIKDLKLIEQQEEEDVLVVLLMMMR